MKKLKLQQLVMLSLIAWASVFFSCKTEPIEPTPTPDPVEPSEPQLPIIPNGFYVFGTNTVATEAGSDASKLDLAVMDPGKGSMVESIAGVYGKFIHIGAQGSIQFTFVESGIRNAYGVDGTASVDSAEAIGGSVKELVLNGSLIKDGQAIEVAEEGLYYLYADMNKLKFVLMPVKANIIGDATEQEWTGGTVLNLVSSDTSVTVFELTELPLVGASGYRYRFNDGWHVLNEDPEITLSSLGVASYADAWSSGTNDLGYFLENCAHKESGVFTIQLKYDAATQTWSETKTKTGELLTDYSDTEFGWFGNAYYVNDTTPGAWTDIDLVQRPIRDGNLYTWSWNLELIEDKSFVLRENVQNGIFITYGSVNKVGAAFDNRFIRKESGQDNYYVAQGGTYTVTLTINAEDEGRTIRIE